MSDIILSMKNWKCSIKFIKLLTCKRMNKKLRSINAYILLLY